MDKDLAQKLKAFHTSCVAAGEDIAFRVFPSKVGSVSVLENNTYSNKILELQELIQSTSLSTSPYYRDSQTTATDATVYPAPVDGEQPQQSKKRKMDDGTSSTSANDTQYARYPNLVLANKRMPDLHAALKKECEELVSLTDQVKLWISLTMPKIEGGDNFGVQIQEEVIAELQRSQDSAFNLRDAARNNYLSRAKICSKLIKYPNVEDYTLALKEHDENQLYFARQHLIDLRNIYAVLTDLIHKNIAKIRAPKGENSVALY